MRNVGVVLVALVVAVGVFVAFINFMPDEEEKPGNTVIQQKVTKVVEKEVPVSNILVASGYIPIGTILSRRNVDVQPWPSHLKLPGFIDIDAPVKKGETKKGVNSVDSMIARTPFQKGEPIIMSKLSNPGDSSFLPSSLRRGMRAVTIPVNRISSVAGFISPGDRVDIIITHNVDASAEQESYNKKSRGETVTEILLSNVKILAVDQKAISTGNPGAKVPNTVTLAVRAEDAQRVLLATKEGKLSLLLRPLDAGDVEVARPTGIADLSRVTPPSYFPVIYDTSVSYVPEMVNLFGEVDLEGLSATEKSLIINAAKGGRIGTRRRARRSSSNSAEKNIGGPRHSVVVIRGIRREVIGVDRP